MERLEDSETLWESDKVDDVGEDGDVISVFIRRPSTTVVTQTKTLVTMRPCISVRSLPGLQLNARAGFNIPG